MLEDMLRETPMYQHIWQKGFKEGFEEGFKIAKEGIKEIEGSEKRGIRSIF